MATRRRRYIDGDVEAEIRRLASHGWNGAQIERQLQRNDAFSGRLPDVRTFQRIAKEYAPPDDSAPWTLDESEPEHIAAGLDMLGYFSYENPRGQPLEVSRQFVATVARLRRGRPDMPLYLQWLVATEYANSKDSGVTASINAFVALAPWRGWDERREYFLAIHERRISAAPTVLLTGSAVVPGVLERFFVECLEQIPRGSSNALRLFESKVLREQIASFEYVKTAISGREFGSGI